MAFLAAIKKRTDLRVKGVKAEQDERDPATVEDIPWITELNPKRFAELPSGGKWMHFHDHKDMWPYWQQAQKLYRAGKLEGVSNMKVSTCHPNHRYGSGVIIFYCGPPDNEEACKKVGRVILKETGYVHLSKKMLYKTDTQTLAKGAQGSHKFVLDIPQENFDNFKKLVKEKKANAKDDEKSDATDAPKAAKAAPAAPKAPPAPTAPKPAPPMAPLPGKQNDSNDVPVAPPMKSAKE